MADLIIPLGRREDFFDESGEPTLRFIRWMESVTSTANDTATTVEVAESPSSFNSQLQQLRKELDGLPEFTMDTEGFTMDSTEFTMDKVIA